MTADVFYATAASGDDLTVDLNYTAGAIIAAGDTFGGIAAAAVASTEPSLVLTSGSTIVIYINSPDSITRNDIGLTVALTVFTSQAMHYKETNVEAAM
jgi:hypothetical protein